MLHEECPRSLGGDDRIPFADLEEVPLPNGGHLLFLFHRDFDTQIDIGRQQPVGNIRLSSGTIGLQRHGIDDLVPPPLLANDNRIRADLEFQGQHLVGIDVRAFFFYQNPFAIERGLLRDDAGTHKHQSNDHTQ